MAISLRLGSWKDHLCPAGSDDPSAIPKSVILPHRSADLGCFALLLLSQAMTQHYRLSMAVSCFCLCKPELK